MEPTNFGVFNPLELVPAQPPLGLFFVIPGLTIPKIQPSGFSSYRAASTMEDTFFLIKHSFQFCLQTSSLCLETFGLVQTFRFSTGRQVLIVNERSSGTQETISLFTKARRLAGRE